MQRELIATWFEKAKEYKLQEMLTKLQTLFELLARGTAEADEQTEDKKAEEEQTTRTEQPDWVGLNYTASSEHFQRPRLDPLLKDPVLKALRPDTVGRLQTSFHEYAYVSL